MNTARRRTASNAAPRLSWLRAATAGTNSTVTNLLLEAQSHPSDTTAWLKLAQAYTTAQQYSAALNAYQRANSINGGRSALALSGMAEVYLAMTGGQGSLTLSAESDTVRSRARQAAPVRSATDIRIVVINANEEETAAHEHILALLDKASAGKTVWRTL